MNSFRHKVILTSLLCFIFGFITPGYAVRIADENEVKAAFVYNFLKFVEWPRRAFFGNSDILHICIVKGSELGRKTTLIEGKKVAHRLIKVNDNCEKESYCDCQAVVICVDDQKEIKTHLTRFKNKPVLTISDCDNFVQSGGMIGLTTISGKVRFSINLKEAENAGLKISSQLLKLAVEVIR